MSTAGLTDALHRITPEQLAAAERTRQYWAGRRMLDEESQVPTGAGLRVGAGDGADDDAGGAPTPAS